MTYSAYDAWKLSGPPDPCHYCCDVECHEGKRMLTRREFREEKAVYDCPHDDFKECDCTTTCECSCHDDE